MTDIQIASNEADARAVTAVAEHHAEMAGRLHRLTEELVGALEAGDDATAGGARYRLVAWCDTELLPHARAEERSLYPAARRTEEGRFLVDALLAEHEDIGRLVQTIASAGEAVRAAGAALSLRALVESHMAKENELVLPLLARLPEVSLAALVEQVHEQLGTGQPDTGHPVDEKRPGGPGCGCGAEHPDGPPELDARSIPHAIRHATIFGALDAVPDGGRMVLVAPHDPVPLLAQLEERAPGRFEVTYLERGPEAWRLAFTARVPA